MNLAIFKFGCYLIVFSLFFSIVNLVNAFEKKEVIVIGTLHGDHSRLPLYNFETLKIVLRHLKPDLLLIEEDPETFEQKLYESMSEDDYLSIRPIEIKTVIVPYAKINNIKIIPTDWRIEFDKEMKSNALKNRALLEDKENQALFQRISTSYESVFMDNYLTKTFYDFHSESTMAILEQYDSLFTGTKLESFRALNRKRQEHINENIINTLKKEKFKRAVIVYGLSHRPFIIRAIKQLKEIHYIEPKDALTPVIPSYFDRIEK